MLIVYQWAENLLMKVKTYRFSLCRHRPVSFNVELGGFVTSIITPYHKMT